MSTLLSRYRSRLTGVKNAFSTSAASQTLQEVSPLIHLDSEEHQRLAPQAENLSWLLRLLPFALFFMVAFSVFAIAVDDPFITFHYAQNVLAGHGPVFNVGERVEGFTSPLHLLVSIALLKIAPSVGVLFKAKCFSLFFGLVILLQMPGLGRRLGLNARQIVFAQTLVALNVNFALTAVNGLETTLFAVLLLASVHRFLIETDQKRGTASALLLFLALLARPETLLIFAGMFCLRAYWNRQQNVGVGSALRWAALFLTLACALFAARMAYYGLPFPNTYYAKHVKLFFGVWNGTEYLLETLWPFRLELHNLRHTGKITPADIQLICAPVFWILALRGLLRARKRHAGMLFGLCIVATCLFVLRAGGDWMPGWRFLTGVLPMLALLQALNFPFRARAAHPASLARSRRILPALASAGVPLILGLWVFAWMLAPHYSWAQSHFSTSNEDLLYNGNCWGNAYVFVSRYFHDTMPPGSVIAYSEIGYSSFMNPDKTFIDVNGLTDRHLAQSDDKYKTEFGVSEDWRVNAQHPLFAYLEQRKPQLIVQMGYALPDGALPSYKLEKMLLIDGAWGGDKTKVAIYRYHPHNVGTEAASAR